MEINRENEGKKEDDERLESGPTGGEGETVRKVRKKATQPPGNEIQWRDRERQRKKKKKKRTNTIPVAKKKPTASRLAASAKSAASALFLSRRISIALHTIAILRGA